MDDIVLKALLFIAGAFIILILCAAFVQTGRMVDLNQQCLADGHKEYECYAMLHGGRGK